ncbi:hypothetical protein CANINC_000318 [Pichia inconspicua]|uniref:Exosome complex component CSL4 C-terminal domain-containing protein n=1 Tax=Pichia inconspicua TaxID=52247 RepID=A0A4T0X8H9_9ASCO|nr:hypothetical protein CANINC_000318 [[Candida] inconspicua]
MSATVQYPEKVLPGQPILPIYQATESSIAIKYVTGENTRVETISFNNEIIPTIIATTMGYVKLEDEIEVDEETGEKKIISNSKSVNVIPNKKLNECDIKCTSYKAVTPQVNDIVLARVTKLTHQRINVEILSVLPKNDNGNGKESLELLNLLPTETGEFFKAIIRSQDIRSTERDSVKTWECYQPGDIIRAIVLSLGDGINFYLSTARNDLGVVFARNEEGELLYPLDWETMVSPNSGEIEKRKCAKPL